jgi:predicted ribosomally synthesized six-cysteine peptide SCIFF
MKHIRIVVKNTIKSGGGTGCGECRSSCQSACKTSCTVGNQSCERESVAGTKTNR